MYVALQCQQQLAAGSNRILELERAGSKGVVQSGSSTYETDSPQHRPYNPPATEVFYLTFSSACPRSCT
eukprot:28561-Eustigmatos_ZCMA.PRE.1